MIGPRFFPEALAEYEDAVVYYETCEEGLGARADELLVVAVFHGRRRPGYWLERLGQLPR